MIREEYECPRCVGSQRINRTAYNPLGEPCDICEGTGLSEKGLRAAQEARTLYEQYDQGDLTAKEYRDRRSALSE